MQGISYCVAGTCKCLSDQLWGLVEEGKSDDSVYLASFHIPGILLLLLVFKGQFFVFVFVFGGGVMQSCNMNICLCDVVCE